MDVFDEAWSVVKRDPRRPWLSARRPDNLENPHREMIGGGVMMGREGFPEEEEIDDLAPQIDMGGDACCIDAKNKWEEVVIEGFPNDWAEDGDANTLSDHHTVSDYYQSILDKYRNMSCDEFREHLESRLGDINMGGLEGQLAMAAHRILQEWDECIQQSMGLGSDEAKDMYLSDEIGESNNEFDTAWDVMKERDKLNWYAEFDGLGGSELMDHEKLGLAGYGTAAKRRGHNVQSFDWGLREDGTDAEFKQGDEDYHIKDIMRGSVKNQVNEILDAFDGEVIDFLSAGIPCKAFSIGGQNVAWKVNEPSMVHFWNKVKPDKDFPDVTEEEIYRVNSKGKQDKVALTPGLKAWGKGGPKSFNRKGEPTSIKALLSSLRSKHGEGIGEKWGKTIFEPKDIEEIMYDHFGKERIRRGKPITEEEARKMRENTLMGLGLMNRMGDITDELYRQGMLGHHMFENPTAKMRYMNELSQYPVLPTSGASFRSPAHAGIFGLPPEPLEFDMGEYLRRRIKETNKKRKKPKPIPEGLPPLKATDLIANLPSNFEIRPFLDKDLAGEFYERGPRGSSSSIQGMPGMPAGYLYPDSPKIDAFHARSLGPYQMGNDIIHALEEHHGIHPGDLNPNDIIRRFKRKRNPTLMDF
jgi:hypothetical protein